ncbi:intradiol ring-cleavage dioxygenase [Pseudonocardia endophytica]|uniref:Dioxygenase-like protein n=1 Tax=Pseudonocardia endophytica TaxID=401976 RepID=A0A4R1HRX8_PSEEN|nr:intradiol ring-cleavage dioxygenase [Pseudonocardia endophytica]TCK25367.1 dioxygenase-like protein [Pseudonocardia endophytica]
MSTRHPHDDFGGISRDLPRLLGRRRFLALLGGAGAVAVAGCSGPGQPPGGGGAGGGEQVAAGTIPSETAGPYPGDGSNGPNVLDDAGVVRRDIRSSFGGTAATAEGVPMTIALTLTRGGAPMAGAAVYAWQCDRDGNYSLYADGLEDVNYLRGVQVADSAGKLEFQSIVPACYDGRWPHVHVEVYSSPADATSSGNAVRTTQLALPKDMCDTVYATPGYEQSVRNLSRVSLDSDMVFSDGHDLQVATVTGTVSAGYTASLAVPL